MERPQQGEVVSERRLCSVCGFPGANFHYGAVSCNGCQAFFRRAVRLNYQPKCKTRTGKCPIISDHRKKCRKCRLEKCLEIGMKVQGVQRDRDPISSARQVSSEEFQAELRNSWLRHQPSLRRSNAAPLQRFDAATRYHSDAVTSFQASDPASICRSDAPTLQHFDATSLQRSHTPSICLPDAAFLYCSDATTPQRSDAASLHVFDAASCSSSDDSLMSLCSSSSSSSSSPAAASEMTAFVLGIPIEPEKPVQTTSIDAPECELLLQQALRFDASLSQLSKAGLQIFRQRRGLSLSWKLKNADSSTLPSVNAFSQTDLNELLRVSATSLIETAKTDMDFCSLQMRDQVLLIRSSSFIMSFLSGVRRSRLFNDVYVTVDEQHAIRFTEVRGSAFLQAIAAFRGTEPDEVEFALLKLITFWNAEVCGKQSRNLVRQNQERYVAALEHHVINKADTVPGTLGRLMLLMSYLQKHSVEARVGTRNRVLKPDELVKEVYLKDIEG